MIIIIFCNVDKFLEKSQCIIWQYGNYTAKSVNKTLINLYKLSFSTIAMTTPVSVTQ